MNHLRSHSVNIYFTRRFQKSKALYLTMILFLGLSGCTSVTPNFDANFGKSLVAIRIAQTKHPMASVANKDKSTDGVEGRVAREAIQRYHQSFVEPPPPVNVFNIGVGSAN